MQSNEIENGWVKNFLGKYILVRSNMAGVFVGILSNIGAQGNILVLENSRRIRRWVGAVDCSDLSVNGMSNPAESTVMLAEEYKVINGWEELGPLTEQARDVIYSCSEYSHENSNG